jgi:hypothetical protein
MSVNRLKDMRRDKLLLGLVAVVLLHLVVTIFHGSAHTTAGVGLGPAGLVFVILVIEIGPLAGLVWMLKNPRTGAALIALTMGAALIFGLVNHYVIPSPDRIDHVHGPAHDLFQTTAALLLVTESAGAALGIAYSLSLTRRIS